MAERNETAIIEKIRYFRLYTEDDNVVKKRAGLYGIGVIAVSLYQKVSLIISFPILEIISILK